MHPNNSETFSRPEWPGADNPSTQLAILESHHTDWMTHWRQALTALIPVELSVRAVALKFVTYADFIQSQTDGQDIQVYAIEALQSLCAWSVDRRAFAQAVDCMFGGGRLPIRDLARRYTPIEQAVRNRCMDSLASAYEAAWNQSYPLRLQTLRQENQFQTLRLTTADEAILHAEFELMIQGCPFAVHLCIPKRAVARLVEPSTEDDPPVQEAVRQVWGSALQHNVYAAPVEAVAVLARKEMTVAQLLSLSIGQVIPLTLSEPVAMMVDGVTVMQGRYGVRAGQYAVKIESIETSNADLAAMAQEQAATVPAAEPMADASSRHLDEAVNAISEFNTLVQQSESTP